MLGLRFIKVPPTTHVIHFRNGQAVRQGPGLSFFCFAPTSVICEIPLAATNVPFVFNEVTSDFQDATVQGELTYRVVDPVRLAGLLDFSVDPRGRYRSEDPAKLSDQLVHEAQIHARSFTQKLPLKQLLVRSDELCTELLAGLRSGEALRRLGLEVLGLTIHSIKATPEMAKALQATAREELLLAADQAVYARRNAAVELERTIKENELNTEIAVEQKQRQVREMQIATELAVEEKRRQVKETQLAAEVALEQQRVALVEQRSANQKLEADARRHVLEATLGPLKDVDWRVLLATSGGQADPRNVIALAFQELAGRADRIGQLNITPDLLQSLLGPQVAAE